METDPFGGSFGFLWGGAGGGCMTVIVVCTRQLGGFLRVAAEMFFPVHGQKQIAIREIHLCC